MQHEHDPISPEQFEAFLDGTLEEADRARVERQLQGDQELLAEATLQGKIDDSLQTMFPITQAPNNLCEVSTAPTAATLQAAPSDPAHLARRRLLVGGVLAAGLAAVLLAWWGNHGTRLLPHFQPTPLASIYEETLNHGFEPYYECEDQARFAATFKQRQGVALRLLAMPAGSRMLGISYPGGLSRETTAMLCEIDQTPVMVFVDRVTADNNLAGQLDEAEESLHVFRQQRDGLVYYEVTPLAESRATQFLVPTVEETD